MLARLAVSKDNSALGADLSYLVFRILSDCLLLALIHGKCFVKNVEEFLLPVASQSLKNVVWDWNVASSFFWSKSATCFSPKGILGLQEQQYAISVPKCLRFLSKRSVIWSRILLPRRANLFLDLIFTCLVNTWGLIALGIHPSRKLELLLMRQRPWQQLWRREGAQVACPQIL